MKLNPGTRHTTLSIWKKDLTTFGPLVELYLKKYGGSKIKESAKKVYYEIHADLLNKDNSKRGAINE